MASTVPKWYPKLKKDDPQEKTHAAIRRAYDYLYSLRDTVNGQARRVNQFLGTSGNVPSLQSLLSTLPGYSLLQTGNSEAVGSLQGSIPTDLSGGFTPTFTAIHIQFAWTGLQIYTPDKATQPQRFIAVPDGVQDSTGLVAATTYYFYPYFDLLAGIVKWAVDPAVAVGVGVANGARSIIAAQIQNADTHKPLSIGAIVFTTAAGGGGGGGGGNGGSGCLQADMYARHWRKGLVRLRDLETGDRVYDRKELAIVEEISVFRTCPGIMVECSNGEQLLGTVTHKNPTNELDQMMALSKLSLNDILFDPTGTPVRIMRIGRMDAVADYVRLKTSSGTLAVGMAFAGILAHNISAGK